jgi:ABC-type nitrate/sulfonate/bicarbonate transport system permease component
LQISAECRVLLQDMVDWTFILTSSTFTIIFKIQVPYSMSMIHTGLRENPLFSYHYCKQDEG